jgi:hypothetical protein
VDRVADVPEVFGPRQTIWAWHRRVASDGTWDIVLQRLLAEADVPQLMRHLCVARVGRGRARTRPDRIRGDKAYSSRAIRGHLRARGITAVIPEPAD